MRDTLYIIAAAVLILLSGCASSTPPVAIVGEAIVRADTRAGIIERTTAEQPTKALAVEIRGDMKEAGAANKAEAAERAKLQAEVEDWRDSWLGGKTKRLLKWIVGIYAGLGIASVLLGVFGGVRGMNISREIVRLFPLFNPFAWARDWLAKRVTA